MNIHTFNALGCLLAVLLLISCAVAAIKTFRLDGEALGFVVILTFAFSVGLLIIVWTQLGIGIFGEPI